MACRFSTAFHISPASGSGQDFQVKKETSPVGCKHQCPVRDQPSREGPRKVMKRCKHFTPFLFLGLYVREMSESWVQVSGRLEEQHVQICPVVDVVHSLSKIRRLSGDVPS
jgi:hypothetical protein